MCLPLALAQAEEIEEAERGFAEGSALMKSSACPNAACGPLSRSAPARALNTLRACAPPDAALRVAGEKLDYEQVLDLLGRALQVKCALFTPNARPHATHSCAPPRPATAPRQVACGARAARCLAGR